MPGAIIFFLLVGCGVGFAVYSSRPSTILAKWAKRHGGVIVSVQKMGIFEGPFKMSRGRGVQVFYVAVRMGDGMVRKAYVRTGNGFMGAMSDTGDVRWDETQ